MSSESPGPDASPRLRLAPPSAWREYGQVAAVLAGVTGVGLVLPESAYLSVGLVYLLAIILLSLRVGRGPVLVAGILGAGIWEYVFIPPHFTFSIGTPQDASMFATYFVVTLVASQFAARVREQAFNERLREERATALFHFTQVLARAQTLDDAVPVALRQTDRLFSARTSLVLADKGDGRLVPHDASSYELEGPERSAMERAFHNRSAAGPAAEASPECAGYYAPLLCGDRAVGVLGVKSSADWAPTLAQRELIEAFATQLALIVEREQLRAAGEREMLLAESERLHRALLDSVSHELRTPLAVVTAALESLDGAPAEARAGLIGEMRTAARRLNRVVGNLLDQTRLESGALRPRMDWCDALDLVNAAVEATRDSIAEHPLQIDVPDGLPSVWADFALTEQALGNLLLNAALHTPPTAPIQIRAGQSGSEAFFTVADRGPGVPAAMRERLFKKFVRGEAARSGGLGLGLSIVHGLVAAQGGEIVVEENPGGGARFTVCLPHVAPQAAELE